MQMNRKQSFIAIYLLTIVSQIQSLTEVLRPRGVPLSKKIFYDPSKEFQCMDGSDQLPFVLVNDDYCDCEDGSDEPGTNACPDGRFHCSNVGYIEAIIPSSRVNDGICDCCDASDEYNSSAKCLNNCMELGEELRQERERHLRLLKEGNEIREQYISDAKKKREESKRELEELRKQRIQVEEEKNAKDSIKKDAEEREKAALDRFKTEEDKIKQQKEEEEILRSQEEDRKIANLAFKEMDLNGDGLLSYTEVQKFDKFDKDGDGSVSEDEAKFFLHAANQMEFEEFVESGWVIMKPYYLKDKTQHEFDGTQEPNRDETKPIESEPIDPNLSETNPDHESAQNDDELSNDAPTEDVEPPAEEEDDEEEDNTPPFFPPRDAELPETTTASQESTTVEYDDETKELIENAKRARDEYSQIEGKFLDMNNKIRELEVNLETDYGPNDEFMTLQGQCFELTDREYIYKLCPFDSASQRSKSGGTETSLGRWGKWIGPESNRYEKMLFEGGATCWNGPARTVAINVKCGTTNEVTAASEPNRCEYEFDFLTPAMCTPNEHHEEHEQHRHIEL